MLFLRGLVAPPCPPVLYRKDKKSLSHPSCKYLNQAFGFINAEADIHTLNRLS